ncbi:MAG: hypothetical protein ACFB21_04710 [Opitutales bacterium]
MKKANAPILQLLRLTAKSEKDFENRLALAVHRQSTSPGFIASLEASVMAKPHDWLALVAWADGENAHRAMAEWFETDYFQDFSDSVAEVEAHKYYRAPHDIRERLADLVYARFLWIEQLALEQQGDEAEVLLRRRRDMLQSTDGFSGTFTFTDPETPGFVALVSGWAKGPAMRRARDTIEAHPSPSVVKTSDDFLRLTSNNVY